MASAYIYFDRRNKTAVVFPIIIRISHKGEVLPIHSGHTCSKEQWDEAGLKIKKSNDYPNYKRANSNISTALADAQKFIADNTNRLNTITCKQLRDEIKLFIKGEEVKPAAQTTAAIFIDSIIKDLNTAGRNKTAAIFKNAKQSLDKYCPKADFKQITPSFLNSYQNWMLSTGMGYGGISVYLRSLRTAFNMAIKAKIVSRDIYPFREFRIKKVKTAKRAIKKVQIDKIRNLKPDPETPLWHHWNYFRFYFNAMGMNFIDVAFLKVGNISDDRLNYIRRKSKRPYNMAMTSEMREVFKIYSKGKKKTDLLFPIMEDVIDSPDKEYIRKTYDNKLGDHVDFLNKLAKMAGIETHITTYTIRHSWASGMRDSNAPISAIKEGMGHDNASTTEIYLSEIEQKIVDDFNEKFLNS